MAHEHQVARGRASSLGGGALDLGGGNNRCGERLGNLGVHNGLEDGVHNHSGAVRLRLGAVEGAAVVSREGVRAVSQHGRGHSLGVSRDRAPHSVLEGRVDLARSSQVAHSIGIRADVVGTVITAVVAAVSGVQHWKRSLGLRRVNDTIGKELAIGANVIGTVVTGISTAAGGLGKHRRPMDGLSISGEGLVSRINLAKEKQTNYTTKTAQINPLTVPSLVRPLTPFEP
mmetsp:Transcript_19192/g.52985  ORF Transcript_19192/g.52985 Transcript_19192/m.52985 type:complete len:229 (+) Transcript_19192:399-1085(+)